MTTCGEVDVLLQVVLTSSVLGGEWLASPRHFILGKEPSVPIAKDRGLVPGSVWMTGRTESS
jgi:hypothetical protein